MAAHEFVAGPNDTCHGDSGGPPNGLEVKRTNGSCACIVYGRQVSTCTASDPSNACASPGNCCGF